MNVSIRKPFHLISTSALVLSLFACAQTQTPEIIASQVVKPLLPVERPSQIVNKLSAATWRVEDILQVDNSNITITFNEDGTVNGSSSCNRYHGIYTVVSNKIIIGKIASTRMACAPTLMAQESNFLNLLGKVKTFSYSTDGALLLTTSSGESITARR